ncbi:peptide/nickel transport system ATP-binding protein [Ketogulonicigenium robustum]|uniref:Peptide/nickel transport system ATP-binding protein n=1 Tax=Ketogulonicigenium robustum TaxID=92947 RepID=A0A1W6NW17_9RHOB|nr:ABC transporter ATP-binding protein [Ketogulonicigenium robustum]ARO13404.1 peptide/nickel transport system ATP-binding protein [Ketogulonicigenium robustum]
MNAPLLKVDKLRIASGASAPIVEQLSFTLNRGETLGLVGESGCGKSMTALAVMRLLAGNLAITGGSIALEGEELTTLPDSAFRDLRGNRMAMIYQEPLTALNPVMTAGAQIVEVLRTHQKMSKAAARARAIELLALVRIPDPAARFSEYPHRMSGGMRQRVVIAMALACNPSLLIADEPTTALDVTVQAQILRLVKQLQREANLGLLLITHDLGVVRQVADRVAVMYAGSLVEEGPTDAVLDTPYHPYTAGLIAARPHGSYAADPTPLTEIRGAVPAPDARPAGCVFAPRCPRATAACEATRPALQTTMDGRAFRCFHPLAEVPA